MVVSLLPVISLQTPVYASFTTVKEEAYPDTNQKFTPIDLRPYATRNFSDDVAGDGEGGWTDQGAENDMRFFTLRGLQTLKGVQFDIINPDTNNGKSVVALRGNNDMALPTMVEVPVNQTAAGVYFLHSSAWLNSVCGWYTFVYEDGTEAKITVRGNKDVFNWWGTGSGDYTITAWTGSNNATSAASLYLFAVENPNPEKKIVKMRLESTGQSYLLIVGMTLTDKGPYLWQDKDRANVDTTNWWKFDLPGYAHIKDTVLDMSFALDAPAGKHGYIKQEGDELYFEDGTKADFWCVNFGPEHLFQEKTVVDDYLDRVAALGFNLVRFHKLGASNVGTGTIYSSGSADEDVDAHRMDQLCYAIQACKERGLYILMDGLCGSSRLNAIYGDQTAWTSDDHEDFRFDYLEQFFTWNNPYTGMTIAEDPAIVFIDLVNENNIYTWVPKDPLVKQEMEGKFTDWLVNKYGSEEGIRKAWYYDGKEGVKEGESVAKRNYDFGTYNTKKSFTRPRMEDVTHFLSDMMLVSLERQGGALREWGYKGLITICTIYGMNSVALTHTNAHGEFVDSHYYWGHPANNLGLRNETSIGGFPTTMMGNTTLGILGRFFHENVYGKAHTITEWEVCQMNPHIFEGPALMSAYSQMQNWQPFYFGIGIAEYDDFNDSAMTEFEGGRDFPKDEYTEDPNIINQFFAMNRQPVQLATMPIAGLAFLRGDISRADRGFYHRYSENDYWNDEYAELPFNSSIGMVGKTGMAYDNIAYDEDYNDNEVLYRGVMSEKLGIPYVSINGEMCTDINNSIFRVNTKNTQYAVGYIGGKSFESDDMIVELETEKASVSITSLSKTEPIWNADKCLITAVGDARNTGEVRSADGLQIVRSGSSPILCEPIVGDITIKTKDDLEIYRIDSCGNRKGKPWTEKTAEGYTVIHLTEDDQCFHFEVVRTKRAEGRAANEHVEFETIEYKSLFEDIGFDHPAYKAIERNCLQDIMRGTSETTFAPESAITRGDFVDSVIKALKISTADKENFADVNSKHPNYNSIMIAKRWGIISGDAEGNFKPNAPITRADAMVILNKAMEHAKEPKKATDANALNSYTDSNKLPDYALASAKAMLSQRCFTELWQGEIQPDKALTRAEAASIIYGILWYEYE